MTTKKHPEDFLVVPMNRLEPQPETLIPLACILAEFIRERDASRNFVADDGDASMPDHSGDDEDR